MRTSKGWAVQGLLVAITYFSGRHGVVLCESGGTRQEQEPVDLHAIGRLVADLRDSEMARAFAVHESALLTNVSNSHAAVSMANLAVRALERHAFSSAATNTTVVVGDPGLFMAVVLSAKSLFDQAITSGNHFGAHYSLGLLLKLYPTYLSMVPTSSTGSSHFVEENDDDDNDSGDKLKPVVTISVDTSSREQQQKSGYEHLCMSLSSYASQLERVYRGACQGGIKVVRSWNEGKGIPSLVHVSPLKWLPQAEAVGSNSSSSRYNTYLVHFLSPVYINGRDFVIHDLFKESRSPRPCHVYLHSSDCYLPLFRQFTRQQQQSPIQSVQGRAASILQFSGTAYYHWLFESLPRLLLLLRQLAPTITTTSSSSSSIPHQQDNRAVILLIPSWSEQQQPYVPETLGLLGLDPARPPAPFSRIMVVRPDDVLAVQELFYVDWAVAPPPPPLRPGRANETSTQLWPPPEALQLVRSTFVPRMPAAAKARDGLVVVLVVRPHDRSRSIVNQGEVVAALERECREAGLTFQVFKGWEAGVVGAINLFPYARVVIGVHGAGLANIVFSAVGTTLMEVTMPEPEFQEYRHAASALGLHYRPVEGLIPPASFESRLWLDPQRLALALRHELLVGDGDHRHHHHGEQQQRGRQSPQECAADDRSTCEVYKSTAWETRVDWCRSVHTH